VNALEGHLGRRCSKKFILLSKNVSQESRLVAHKMDAVLSEKLNWIFVLVAVKYGFNPSRIKIAH
jgi:hypothetical protein